MGVGWRRLIRVARRDAALIKRPTWTSGFILFEEEQKGEVVQN